MRAASIVLAPLPRLRERDASAERVAPLPLLRHARLDRILHVLDLLELDVLQDAADLLDLAEIDGLDDVARLRVGRDRAARAFPGETLGGRDQRVAVGLAAGRRASRSSPNAMPSSKAAPAASPSIDATSGWRSASAGDARATIALGCGTISAYGARKVS